jgi:hypothetical protein
VKVFIKVAFAVFLYLVWASFDSAYADHKPVTSVDKHLKLRNETAISKDTKSVPVTREEPAPRVIEPVDAAPVK